jgi:hypothetical protein
MPNVEQDAQFCNAVGKQAVTARIDPSTYSCSELPGRASTSYTPATSIQSRSNRGHGSRATLNMFLQQAWVLKYTHPVFLFAQDAVEFWY